MSDTLDPLKALADAIEMPVEHLKEAVEGIRQERLKEALLAKVQIIRGRNAAILPSGEIVSRGTTGAMAYESPASEPLSETEQLAEPSSNADELDINLCLDVGLFTKKSITVEAIQFTNKTKDRAYRWSQELQNNIYHSWDDHNPCLIIPTSEGEMVCRLGDWLIKEPFPTNGRKVYPCKSDVFSSTYTSGIISNIPRADIEPLVDACDEFVGAWEEGLGGDSAYFKRIKAALETFTAKHGGAEG